MSHCVERTYIIHKLNQNETYIRDKEKSQQLIQANLPHHLRSFVVDVAAATHTHNIFLSIPIFSFKEVTSKQANEDYDDASNLFNAMLLLYLCMQINASQALGLTLDHTRKVLIHFYSFICIFHFIYCIKSFQKIFVSNWKTIDGQR